MNVLPEELNNIVFDYKHNLDSLDIFRELKEKFNTCMRCKSIQFVKQCKKCCRSFCKSCTSDYDYATNEIFRFCPNCRMNETITRILTEDFEYSEPMYEKNMYIEKINLMFAEYKYEIYKIKEGIICCLCAWFIPDEKITHEQLFNYINEFKKLNPVGKKH